MAEKQMAENSWGAHQEAGGIWRIVIRKSLYVTPFVWVIFVLDLFVLIDK